MFRSLTPLQMWMVGALALLVLSVIVAWLGVVVIDENEAGLVIKKYGAALPPGRIIALDGEAGFQARLLSPGFHFGLWPWQYKVQKVPLVVIPSGEIGLVVAADGAAVPAERLLGRAVPCDDFQDAEAFLRRGGERGRQIAILTAGTYRINPALFEIVRGAKVTVLPPETVGIVTTLDGRAITAGDLAGPSVAGHDSFQNGQRFVEAGGCRGLQEDVLLSGSWNLNPWFVQVEPIPMTEIPIGYVGVVVSYVGREHLDVSGAEFTHGDLVEKGRKGVWVEPLLPGKHPLNTRVMKVELVPTTNIVLNWAARTEAHEYDKRLSPITVRSKDGFAFSLDVSQIIHIRVANAPRVISRVGSMQNLVDHVLQPTVANYFRNSAQEVTVLEFLSARTERQRAAYENIKAAIEAYDVECIDTLIGDIVPPAALMETQTERKIAEELRRTYEAQRDAHVKRQELERESAKANLQAEVVRSEQEARIAEGHARAVAEAARGEAEAQRLRAEGAAAALKLSAEAEAEATRARASADAEATTKLGAAKADAYTKGVAAVGEGGYTAIQLAALFAEHGTKLVPDVAVGGNGSGAGGGLAEVLIARMLKGTSGVA